MKELISSREASKTLCVSKKTILEWFHKGLFPNAFQIGRLIRIPVSDVEALKQQGRKKGA